MLGERLLETGAVLSRAVVAEPCPCIVAWLIGQSALGVCVRASV